MSSLNRTMLAILQTLVARYHLAPPGPVRFSKRRGEGLEGGWSTP